MLNIARRKGPALTRRQKLLRDGLLLLLSLLVLVAALDFPIPTAELAFRAAERRSFFAPGEIILEVDAADLSAKNRTLNFDRAFVSRRGNWFAYGEVRRDLLSWQSNPLYIFEHDPAKPLELLTPDYSRVRRLLVVSDLEAVVSVEITYPANDSGWHPVTQREDTVGQGCFFFALDEAWQPYYGPEEIQLRGYDMDGNLIYESPSHTG